MNVDSDIGVLRRVKTALTPMSLDAKIKQVSAVEDRIALEVAAYKRRVAEIEWDKKASISSFLWKKQSGQGSVARIKLHVEAALHKRAVEVLRANVDSNGYWKDHLRRDTIYRTLHSQGKWLKAILNNAKSIPNSAFRRQSADEVKIVSRVRRFSLDDTSSEPELGTLQYILFMDNAPSEFPSEAYLAFEMFLATSRFDKTDIGVAFEQHCCTSLLSLSSSSTFQSLVTQLANAIADEHDVSPNHPRLIAMVRQLVYSRMAGVFCAPHASKLEKDQLALNKSVGPVALLELREIGLPCSMKSFPFTIAAFESLPYFMPDQIVHELLKAITIMHNEVAIALSCNHTTISADILLPVLVAIVSNTKLPFLQAQVFAMESFAFCNGQDGGEAAYYVALLQSAIAAALAL